MRSLPLRGVRDALIVAPHPDDEAIGAFGLIRTLRRHGARVRIAVIADGAASHPRSVRWPRARLVAERRRETRRAMRPLGVTARNIRFLGLPDGNVGDASVQRWIGLRRAIRSVRPAGLLILPDRADAHPDHRTVARIAAEIAAPGVRRFSYIVWPGRPRGARPTHGLALGQSRTAKRAAILRYRTQTGDIVDDPGGFAIAPHELRGFARPIELYRELRR